MDDQEVFECTKLNCRLTAQACIDRRKAFKEHSSSGKLIPIYPECQECSKVFYVKPQTETDKNKNKGGEKMMAAKIEKESLENLVKEGKSLHKIGEIFGCCTNTIINYMKKWDIKSNRSKKKNAKAGIVKREKTVSVKPKNNIPQIMPAASHYHIKAADLLVQENEELSAKIEENNGMIKSLMAG